MGYSRDPGSGIRGPGSGVQDPGSGIRFLSKARRIPDPGPRIPDPGSIRIAVALNSAVPTSGSVASLVSTLVATSSGKWNVMKVRPGRSAWSMCTGATTTPRREVMRTGWPSAKTETATRLRSRLELVLDYAAVHEGIDRRNPARWKGNLDKVFPTPKKISKVVHHPAAAYIEVPNIMSHLRGKNTASAYNLRFTILTASRSGESRGALWSEIDMANKVWTIPASRMKAEREHKVPLCDEAIEVLTIMKKWNIKDSDIVFMGSRETSITDVAINKTLHAINPNITVHGFRSSFRVWGAETTSTPSAVLELALAHVNQNEVEAAYQRSDLFERRRDLMTIWGNYCKTKGNVVKLVQRA